MKPLLTFVLFVLLATSAIAGERVTQKIRAKEIRNGSADLIWRQGDGYEWFTVRIPAGEWQLVCIYPDGWSFVVATLHGGDYAVQWRDAEMNFDFRLVKIN